MKTMKKKKFNPFLTTLFILFIIYISLYIAGMSGYYENKINNEIVLTEQSIKEFEKDIKNNKDIDLKKYTKVDNKDYSCFASNMGDSFSGFISKLFTEEFGKFGKVLKKMFTN